MESHSSHNHQETTTSDNHDMHGTQGTHDVYSTHGINQSLEEIVGEINAKNNKKTHVIRVLIIKDDNKYSDNFTDNENFYGGYHYDVFKMLLQDKDGGLYQNYRYEIYYSDPDNLNYDLFVDEVYEDKYDIVIGGFSINRKRQELINYSIPLYINRVGILHFKKQKFLQGVKILGKETFYIFTAIIFFGVLFAILYHFLFPHMYIQEDKKITKKNGKKTFIEHLSASIPFFFGEMGMLTENVDRSYIGVFVTIVAMIFSFMLLFYAQARFTTVALLLETQESELEFENINSDIYRPFLAKEGNAESYKLQLLRGQEERVVIEDIGNDYLVQKYAYEKNDYDGVVMLYTDAYQYLIDRNYDFTFSMDGYGLEPSCWIVSQRPHCISVLKDINLLILKHRSLGTNTMSDTIEFGHLTMICKNYIREKNACLF